MKVLSLTGLALFMLTSLVVGVRLLALWRRTRKTPELLLALALLCTGFLAYAVVTAAKLLIVGSDDVRRVVTVLTQAIECIGIASLIAFSWQVFHRRQKWATALALLLCLAIVASLAGEIISGEYLRYSDSRPIQGPYVPVALAARGTGPAWMAIECFRYHAKLRRQLALGLASPLVANRVLLWGIGIGSSAIAYAFSVVHRLIFGIGLREHDWALGTASFLALISALSIGLAFFPPAAYRRWAEKRS